ncbi:MAG: alpha/beta fold hydrolase [Flavobacteriaceae bacterium]|nr:alpha/beta fold hydrolase [Flavobacteriaceae bacterium]
MKKYIVVIKILLLLGVLSCLAKTKSQVEIEYQIRSFNEERVEFTLGRDTLVGYLSKPSNTKKYPVIVVLHSASHGHHNNQLYNHLEKNMNEIGVAVFTYDRRGSGESTGDFNTASLETLAKDALSAVNVLVQRKDIKTNQVGFFGISQGGWLAPCAYSISPKYISFMVLVSSSGVSPAKQMEYSAVTTLRMNNYSDSVIKVAKHLRSITNEYYRGNKERQSTQEEIDEYKEEEWFSDVYLPWRGNLPEDVTTTKWIHEMDFDPREYYQKVDIPIMLFYGEADRWVPIDESVHVWKEVFDKNGNSKFEIIRVKSAGHMMILNEDSNPEEEIISEQYTAELKKWVSNILKE